MNSPPPVIDALRRLAGPGPSDIADAELLARFVSSRDEAAFEALVRRHGGLVWGACRRRLRDPHAAEDAFQTTFLALARHATTIRRPDALGAWLHRVAVRCTAAFRPPRNIMRPPSLDVPALGPDPLAAASGQELERVIDEEIDALPEPFRLAFVLCEVERRTAADAAMSLGIPVGTVESRLTRARQRLRARLTRRGVTVGALSGLALVADAVPASARVGAVAMATGMSPVPAALALVADKAVRAGVKTATIGVSAVGAVGIVGLTGLFWIMTQGAVPSAQKPAPAPAAASHDLPIPEPDQFRRNRFNFPLPPEAIARVGDPWLRHGAPPQRLAYSGDGKFLATGGAGDRWLRVWDLDKRQPRAHLALSPGDVPAAVALNSDGRTLRALVFSGNNRAAQLREYDTYRALETRRRQVLAGPADSAAFDPDGALMAVGKNAQVRVYDTSSAMEIWRADVAPADRVEVAFSPNGRRIAAVPTGSSQALVFDAGSGRVDAVLSDSRAVYSQPAFTGDGGQIAIWCSASLNVRVWDVGTRTLIRSCSAGHDLSGFAFSPDARAVVGFSPTRSAMVFAADRDAPQNRTYQSFVGIWGRFSPDGSTLAARILVGRDSDLRQSGTVVRACRCHGRADPQADHIRARWPATAD
jgi:RNA polymerase sigma factor (sigma-70 family)